MHPLLSYLLAGSLGVLLQITALKYPTLKAKYNVTNKPFSFKQYLSDDWSTILASFVSIGILIVGWEEIIGIKPELANYVIWVFVLVGFTGSTIIQAVLSIANKKIMAIIDVKTNIADDLPLTPKQEEIAKKEIG